MENKSIFDLEQQLTNIDTNNIKSDAIIQQAFAVSLANTLTHMGTMAATSTTTMAKTVLLTTASEIGKLAMGTTKKIWGFVISSNDV